MRIAYIAPYQGPALLKQRPIVRNLSLAANVKIGLIAELLQRSSHAVEILSQGEVIERRFKLYPSLSELEGPPPSVPVYYASALPVKFLNGFWSSQSMLQLFKTRHHRSNFDAVIIYNLKPPQVACASHAMKHLGLPVILQYEDGSAGVWAEKEGLMSKYYYSKAKSLRGSVSGCMAVSPLLLSQTAPYIPKLLLRGVVADTFLTADNSDKHNWVVFSGTHDPTQGLEQLITAWQLTNLPGWELHIAGTGVITERLKKLANGNRTIIFRGLLDRVQNARLMCSARIGINPMNLSKVRGNDFPFKLIEYLAAGLHVITTPRGTIEPDLECGISYIENNSPDLIAAGLRTAISGRAFERTAEEAAIRAYGPSAVTTSLNKLLDEVVAAPVRVKVPNASNAHACA